MKFRITFKDPDGVYDSLTDVVNNYRIVDGDLEPFDCDDISELPELIRDKLREFMQSWIEYDEYVTIEFDTAANTCVVVPRN